MTPRSHETTHPFQSPFSASHALGSCQPHSPETICAIPSTSHHIPTPLKSSQTHTLQILLPHQDSPSNPDTPVCSHTLRDFPTSSSILWSFFSKNDRRFRVLHVTPKLICTIRSQAPDGTSGKSFLPTQQPQLSYRAPLLLPSVKPASASFFSCSALRAAVRACIELGDTADPKGNCRTKL